MNSKKTILDSLRQTQLPDVELPSLREDWTTYSEPEQQFCEVLKAGGGTAIDVGARSNIGSALEQVEAFRNAEQVWSLVPEVASKGSDWTGVTDPHDLEKLEFCVVPAEFAVAENGAAWLGNDAVSPRAALFITQHLAIVVPKSELVQNMHEAYDRISFEGARFGVFVSGPSKTADIEQSLVIGAHGARSLTVLLVDA